MSEVINQLQLVATHLDWSLLREQLTKVIGETDTLVLTAACVQYNAQAGEEEVTPSDLITLLLTGQDKKNIKGKVTSFLRGFSDVTTEKWRKLFWKEDEVEDKIQDCCLKIIEA